LSDNLYVFADASDKPLLIDVINKDIDNINLEGDYTVNPFVNAECINLLGDKPIMIPVIDGLMPTNCEVK